MCPAGASPLDMIAYHKNNMIENAILPTPADLLNRLHHGGQYAYLWTNPGKRSTWFKVGDPLPTPADDEHDNYFSVHPTAVLKGEYERATIPDVAAINCLFAEFDAKDFGNDKKKAKQHIQSLAIHPSIIIDSGGGFHTYWLLNEPFYFTLDHERERAKRVQAAWVSHVGADDGSKDLARVLRLPGTFNFKYLPPICPCPNPQDLESLAGCAPRSSLPCSKS